LTTTHVTAAHQTLLLDADLPNPCQTYRVGVVTLIRVARLVLLLVLAVIAVSLIIAMFRPETGGYEKAALAALAAACVGMGIAVTSTATYLRRRLAVSRQSPGNQ
jgi:hypothetical protein